MEGGGRGGVDFAFLSTTTNLEVAVSYIGDKAMPVLFEFDVGDIDRGASSRSSRIWPPVALRIKTSYHRSDLSSQETRMPRA